jgi:hypothetical protein
LHSCFGASLNRTLPSYSSPKKTLSARSASAFAASCLSAIFCAKSSCCCLRAVTHTQHMSPTDRAVRSPAQSHVISKATSKGQLRSRGRYPCSEESLPLCDEFCGSTTYLAYSRRSPSQSIIPVHPHPARQPDHWSVSRSGIRLIQHLDSSPSRLLVWFRRCIIGYFPIHLLPRESARVWPPSVQAGSPG